MAKLRLDTLLAQRGLFASRARAAASVMAGEVRLGGSGGARAAKPGQMVAEDVEVAVDERPRFVSRGGIKLANALDATGIDPAGRRCLDVGASTGGFTDCLLQRGAAARRRARRRLRRAGLVAAHRRARHGARAHERARAAPPATCPTRPTSSWPTSRSSRWPRSCPRCSRCCAERFDALAMVKPQFEVGRERVGKGGRRARARGPPGGARRGRRRARARTAPRCSASRSSGLPGPKGNRETFVWLAEAGRAARRSATSTPLAREVEP